MYVCMSLCIYICMYLCMCVWIFYLYMWVCTHVYIRCVCIMSVCKLMSVCMQVCPILWVYLSLLSGPSTCAINTISPWCLTYTAVLDLRTVSTIVDALSNRPGQNLRTGIWLYRRSMRWHLDMEVIPVSWDSNCLMNLREISPSRTTACWWTSMNNHILLFERFYLFDIKL